MNQTSSFRLLGTLLSLAFALCLALPAAAQREGRRSLADVSLPDSGQIRRFLAARFDVVCLNRPARIATVAASEADLARMQTLGFCPTVRKAVPPEAYSSYTDPEELALVLEQAETNHPTIAKRILLKDQLFEGQKLYAMKITKDVDAPNERPSFFLDAQHHASEIMGVEIASDMVEYLTSRYESDAQVQRWVDNINIYIVPCVNPDGSMHVFRDGDFSWRKNRDPQCGASAIGVDINRNYDQNWSACEGSSGDCRDMTYRGPAPSSEPETQGMEALLAEASAVFGISYHMAGEVLFYPYGCWEPDEKDLFVSVAQEMNSVIQNDAGQTGHYEIGTTALGGTEPVDGSSQDEAYGAHGTYDYIIELNSTFPPDYATWRDVTVQRQRPGWQILLDKTLDAPQIRGRVTDALTGEPLPAEAALREVTFTHGEAPRRADSRGLYHRLVKGPGTYHLAVSYAGYCTQEREVPVGSSPVDLDVALEPSGTVVPGTPAPSDGAMNVGLSVTLSWAETGAQAYDVYFGATADPPKAATVSEASFTPPPPLDPAATYYWKIATASSCGSATGPLWSFRTLPYQVTNVTKKGNPFRLTVTGTGFTDACTVKISGKAVPQTLYMGPSSLFAKGGAALKAMVPKGTSVQVTVEDPIGGKSNSYSFGW